MSATQPSALLVRAVLKNSARRDEFDSWYENEHLPQVFDALEARTASRWWSDGEMDEPVHYAIYEFAGPEQLEAALSGHSIQDLINEFNAAWGNDVERSRSRARRAQSLTR